ncbi:Ribosomal silencing factor RsfS [Maioricimonas rarisocia]|uniref:Ribosomal silencing factor RsfS n=1 Tax=Maioricimonas rarisocia TaxID=2528026 RepID=A0A517Z323_9PLAN|nr:ribosome silencing factor [Maioricimonas rarisocia]QDU36892.1 Ribosomal silencing factor RsfS [Maioricimonas rarisocia]
MKTTGSSTISSSTSTSAASSRSLQHACLCARACDNLRGENTIVLDLTGITPLFDYFVITTGNSRRQMHAIAEECDRVLAQQNSRRMGVEGYDESNWIVEDYGDVVLHVFTGETRELYDLENLWADAPQVDWQDQLEKSGAAPPDSPPGDEPSTD